MIIINNKLFKRTTVKLYNVRYGNFVLIGANCSKFALNSDFHLPANVLFASMKAL